MEQKRIPLTIKTQSDGTFEGYGSVFNNVDLGGDVIVPGAFSRTLKRHKDDDSLPLMFWAHDPAQVPGKWTDMREDKRGLFVKGELADTQLGREVGTLLRMKAVRGLSIGFGINPHGVDYDDDGTRFIKDVELYEVSVVSLAMNPSAQVLHAKTRLSAAGEFVPSAPEIAALKRKLEGWLRSQGLSKAAAIMYASQAFQVGDIEDAPTTGDVETTEAERRDAVEDVELAKRLDNMANAMLADIFNRSLQRGLANG